MVSAGSVGIGLGVTLGAVGAIVVGLIILSIVVSRARSRFIRDELSRRRSAQRRRHVREQQHWRERRLRDVVIVLLDRGEVEEGVPLAFQVSTRAEVPARRDLRSNRNVELQRIEEDLVEEADAQLDPESRAIVQRSLEDLLANGRPADAEAGPDVLQLLLDGQELRQQSEANFSEMHSIHGEEVGGDDDVLIPSNFLSPITAEEREQQRQQRQHDEIVRQLRSPNAEDRMMKREERVRRIYGTATAYLHNPANDGHRSPPLISTVEFEQSMQEPQSPIARLLGPLSPFRKRNRHRSFSSAVVHDEDDHGASEGGRETQYNNFLRSVSSPPRNNNNNVAGGASYAATFSQPTAPTLDAPPTRLTANRDARGAGDVSPF